MAKVRLLQVKSDESESVEARIERVIAELPKHLVEADLVVLPELWTIHAFNTNGLTESALAIDAPIFHKFGEIAKSANKWIHAGTFPIKHPDGSITNTAVIFGADGKMQIIYSKIYLFGFDDGEPKYLTAGNKIAVSKTPLGETGISICYDLRFPELFREQINRGAKTLLISAGWPTVRANHWKALLVARAVENQAFVVAACGRGTANGIELAGASMVIDPMGNVQVEGNLNEEYVDAEIDLAVVDKWRAEFPVLSNRRDLHNL
ncbi:MAG: hypothetical protein RLZZ330_943 [Actinomycetota bacterium]|jgi:predicted amidohydrolase